MAEPRCLKINRKLLNRGLVIQLASSVSDIIERTRFDSARPLLATDDRASRIREIMLERGPVYDEVCNEKVITSRKPIDVVVEKILALESVREIVDCARQHKNEGGDK